MANFDIKQKDKNNIENVPNNTSLQFIWPDFLNTTNHKYHNKSLITSIF